MMALAAWPARRGRPPMPPHRIRIPASSPWQPASFHVSSYRFNLPMHLNSPGVSDSHRIATAQRRGRATGRVPNPSIHSFAVQRNVQAFAFLFLGDTQANGQVDELQNDKADHKAVNQRGPYAP